MKAEDQFFEGICQRPLLQKIVGGNSQKIFSVELIEQCFNQNAQCILCTTYCIMLMHCVPES